MTQKRENPLAGNQGARTFSRGNTPSLTPKADETTATALVAGVHVVVVETVHGRHRRRVYFNLPSAQRAADRAIMAGHPANVILCQLMPVTGGADL
jgi:hypothetical protein